MRVSESYWKERLCSSSSGRRRKKFCEVTNTRQNGVVCASRVRSNVEGMHLRRRILGCICREEMGRAGGRPSKWLDHNSSPADGGDGSFWSQAGSGECGVKLQRGQIWR